MSNVFATIPQTIIYANRGARPEYPKGKSGVHPRQERNGPLSYDLATKVELWHHSDQEGGRITGKKIYKIFDKRDLERHLGISDALEIQKIGAMVFRKLYAGRVIFFLRSVVQDCDGKFFVPCLYEYSLGVVLSWRNLDSPWHDNYYAMRFVWHA